MIPSMTITIAAKYDAAQTTPDNMRHWAAADGLSAAQAANAGVRYIIRNRSRYEAANNSYLAGLAANLAGDTIGTGPTLQLNTDDTDGNTRIERAWNHWTEEVQLAKKLRMARMAKMIDGECFFQFYTDNSLRSPIKLNVQILPAEMITNPRTRLGDWGDGIEHDVHGRPLRYWRMTHHPSEMYGTPVPIDARYVMHYANFTRPGQVRGISETAPALHLYAQLRRFTYATLAAAETAADFAAILESSAPATEEDDDLAPLTQFEIFQRMMVTAPKGYKLSQLKAEHPATTHEMFLYCILQEIAACHQVPLYLVAGTAKDLSYAGGRLDLQSYARTIRTERHELAPILNQTFNLWLDEALFVPGLLPQAVDPFYQWDKQWFWPPFEHVDPLKEATAVDIRLANNTTTLADEWGKQNADWEKKVKQRAREKAMLRELGLTDAEARPGKAVSADVAAALVREAIAEELAS